MTRLPELRCLVRPNLPAAATPAPVLECLPFSQQMGCVIHAIEELFLPLDVTRPFGILASTCLPTYLTYLPKVHIPSLNTKLVVRGWILASTLPGPASSKSTSLQLLIEPHT